MSAAACMTRDEVTTWLENYFAAYYDVNKVPDVQGPLVLRCDLHVNNQKYVLFKKNVIWEANCHEYVYLFSVPHLTYDIYKECEKLAYDAGMELIEPVPGHMYTYISCMIIADGAEPEAVKALKKCRLRKSFRFSLRGWMEFHTALLDLGSDRGYTNHPGREFAKLFKSIIQKRKGESK